MRHRANASEFPKTKGALSTGSLFSGTGILFSGARHHQIHTLINQVHEPHGHHGHYRGARTDSASVPLKHGNIISVQTVSFPHPTHRLVNFERFSGYPASYTRLALHDLTSARLAVNGRLWCATHNLFKLWRAQMGTCRWITGREKPV